MNNFSAGNDDSRLLLTRVRQRQTSKEIINKGEQAEKAGYVQNKLVVLNEKKILKNKKERSKR